MNNMFDAEAIGWIMLLLAAIWPTIKFIAAVGAAEIRHEIKPLERYDSKAALAKDNRRYGKEYGYAGHRV